MELSRRRFLESSAMVAAVSATGLGAVAAASDSLTLTPARDVIARLTLADAKYLVGSVFLARTSSGKAQLRCVEVTATAEQDSGGSNQAFAIKFLQAEGSAPLKEGTYRFQHDVLGQFRLFIIPSGSGVTPRSYTAIVNHQDLESAPSTAKK
jgi:hypothetical protein